MAAGGENVICSRHDMILRPCGYLVAAKSLEYVGGGRGAVRREGSRGAGGRGGRGVGGRGGRGEEKRMGNSHTTV